MSSDKRFLLTEKMPLLTSNGALLTEKMSLLTNKEALLTEKMSLLGDKGPIPYGKLSKTRNGLELPVTGLLSMIRER